MRDVRQRLDNLAHDVKRKDSQVKELQSRLDSGEGCKLCLFQNVSVLGSGRFQAPMQVHSFCFFSVQSDFFTAGSGHEKYLISNLRCFLTHRILPVPNILCIFSEFMLIFIEVSWIICLKLTCVPVWLSGLEQGYYHSQTLIVKSHRSLFFLCQFKRERQRERERERQTNHEVLISILYSLDLSQTSGEISLVKSLLWNRFSDDFSFCLQLQTHHSLGVEIMVILFILLSELFVF